MKVFLDEKAKKQSDKYQDPSQSKSFVKNIMGVNNKGLGYFIDGKDSQQILDLNLWFLIKTRVQINCVNFH